MKNIIKKWLGLDKLDEFENKLNKLEKYEECEKCGCVCNRHKMKTVKYVSYIFGYTNFYCEKHAPKYNEVKLEYVGLYNPDKFKKTYYKNNVEVNEQGKPICTKK